MRAAVVPIVVILACLFSDCGDAPPTQARSGAAMPDSSATSLDWEGTYRGVVPCADCEGIETTVTLRRHGSYHLKTRYVGKSGGAFAWQGRFVWNVAGDTIALGGLRNRPNRFLVGENHLLQLDMEGKRITGALADRYRLPKVIQEPKP